MLSSGEWELWDRFQPEGMGGRSSPARRDAVVVVGGKMEGTYESVVPLADHLQSTAVAVAGAAVAVA
jgi:hypothetical protein